MASSNNVEIEEFLNGALVSWLESCLPRPEILSGYSSLLDGKIIHSVWLQIDPEPQSNPNDLNILEGGSLLMARAKNFDLIIRNLKQLYEDELGQTIITLPNSYVLGYCAETRAGLDQMKILLTLLLGAAVQCPNKEIFIGRIKELDLNIQHEIVELIKQVTDNHSLVLTQESLELLTPTKMYDHIIRLTKERDNFYFKWITSITTESEQTNVNTDTTQISPVSSGSISGTISSSSSENNHLAVELADLKSRLRKLRSELEEKSEAYLESKEELDHKNSQYEKLRNESQEWYTEAKRAATYRDEVDVLRERAERADYLEIEVQKFREKLTDSEFYKSRVEELREDNRMLLETKEMLEDQLQRSRKRSEHVMLLESEIIKYKQKLNDMALERDVDRSKLQEILEENTQLQLVAKNINSNLDINKSMSDNDDECNSGDNSLSEQLTNNAQTRALKLELENRRLMQAIDQLKETSFHESTNKILELEKDKKKLSLKLDQLQENCNRLVQQNKELEDLFKNALDENKKLQDSLGLRQKLTERQNQERDIEKQKLIDFEKQIEILNKEKQRIQNLNDSIQRRADDTERLIDIKLKEIEQLNQKQIEFDEIKNFNYDINIKLNAYERENLSLLKEITKLKDVLELKSVQYDENLILNDNLLKEIQELKRNLTQFDSNSVKLVELENNNLDLISKNKINLETIKTLQNDLIINKLNTNKFHKNFEKLGFNNDEIINTTKNSDNIVENVVEKLIKNPETFKTVREIILNITKETNKSDICVLCHHKEIYTVEKNIELKNNLTENYSENFLLLNDNLLNDDEKKNFLIKIDLLTNTNNKLQNANDILQDENARINVDIAKLSSQITSLNTQHIALQLANSQLAADKDILIKNYDKLLDSNKNLLHDQNTLQYLHDQLNIEYDKLNNDKELLKINIRDLRNENRDSKDIIITLEKKINDLNIQINLLKQTSNDLNVLRTEHSKLTDDFRNLFSTSDRFKNEYKNIQGQYKIIRAENSRIKLQNTELSDQVKIMEIDYSKVSQRCEMLLHQNTNLDIDRRTLMDNVSQLLTQYHELLTHSLEDKKHYHDEEKNFTDKVNSLNRQKEKLEEKIMETYRKSESCAPKKKAFGSSFVKRVKKDLMNMVPIRNRRSWIEDSRINQSQLPGGGGSESGGNDSDNSTEEQNSVTSETNLFQRNIPQRQSLQRNLNESSESSLSRGGVRSSLQLHTRSDNTRRNSVHGLEAADVTGSSLTLGAAGTRRTVYLIDENQKLPDPQITPNESIPESFSVTNNKKNDTPSTFLINNRINTVIGSSTGNINKNRSESDISGNNVSSEKDEKKLTVEENSIWYEYGCV